MTAPGKLRVGSERIDDGDVAVQADHDEDHGREVEAEGAQERKRFAGSVSSQPKPKETPSNLKHKTKL